MPTISEAHPLVAHESVGKPGIFEIQIITPGAGSSGVYSAECLQEAATSKAWPAGTQMFLDHPSESEKYERPERSVRDLAGALMEDARWDADAGALVAKARVYSMYAPLLAEAAGDIGLSIRALAEKNGDQVTKITEGLSIDYVTRAGRGGKVLAVLESARAGLREATVDDRREQLSTVLPGRSYVRDYDPDKSIVYYATYDDQSDHNSMWSQAYTVAADDQSVALTGAPTEVRQVTQYLPLTASDGNPSAPIVSASSAGQTNESTPKELIMPQIDEAELSKLREAKNEVTTLTQQVTDLTKERDTYKATLAESTIRESAAKIVDATEFGTLPDKSKERATREALRDLPLTSDGVLDEARLRENAAKAVKDEAAYLADVSPAAVTGFGQSSASESTPRRTHNAWGRPRTKEA